MRTNTLLQYFAASILALGATLSHAGTGSLEEPHKIDSSQDALNMKNVILIGANGHTSKEIIPRLLAQKDVKLTLFLRRASRMQDMQSDRAAVVEGDASNLTDLTRAISGQEIVISTMGGSDLAQKTDNILQAMKAVGARHFIVTSAGGIYDELPEPFNSWDKRRVGDDREINLKVAEETERSGLTYTVLRPVWLTNSTTDVYELTQKGETFKGTETSRASLARLVADIVSNPARFANQNLGVSQPNTDGDRPAAYR